MPSPAICTKAICGIGAAIALGVTAPALAANAPSTKIVACDGGSCLVVSGTREGRSEAVSINGHAVAVQGGRKWKVRLPVATIRDWSPRFARSIEVTTRDASSGRLATSEARLPIGLLGGTTDLALLEIRVK